MDPADAAGAAILRVAHEILGKTPWRGSFGALANEWRRASPSPLTRSKKRPAEAVPSRAATARDRLAPARSRAGVVGRRAPGESGLARAPGALERGPPRRRLCAGSAGRLPIYPRPGRPPAPGRPPGTADGGAGRSLLRPRRRRIPCVTRRRTISQPRPQRSLHARFPARLGGRSEPRRRDEPGATTGGPSPRRTGDGAAQRSSARPVERRSGRRGPAHRPGTGDRLGVAFPRGDGPGRARPGRASADNLGLAFALTVHKAQGSEYDRVALVLPASDGIAVDRERSSTPPSPARATASSSSAIWTCSQRRPAASCTRPWFSGEAGCGDSSAPGQLPCLAARRLTCSAWMAARRTPRPPPGPLMVICLAANARSRSA